MPYLGSTPNASFSTRTKQDFTANGSTTAFTLSSAVASANDIEVFVGNVRQEPTDAYTISGTTLTMSEAPETGLNFYVVFKGLEENSVVPAAGTTVPGNFGVSGDLTVDTNVLKVDASNNRVGVNLTSPTHPLSVNGQIKSTGSNGETVQLQTSSQYTGISFIGSDGTRDAIIDYNHTGGVMGIKAHTSGHKISMTTGGYTERLVIDADGRVITPSQPAFSAYHTIGNVAVTAEADIVLPSTLYNIGGHYSTSTGKFTAPVAGMYFFNAHMYFQGLNNYHRLRFYKNGSIIRYQLHHGNGGASSYTVHGVCQMNLAANDVVKITFQADTAANYYVADNHTNFSGYLIG